MITGTQQSDVLSSEQIRSFYDSEAAKDHYVRATSSVGLWRSEELVFQRVFADKAASLLELGCGAGRISFGLVDLGYRHMIATDFSKGMVKAALRIARCMEYPVPVRCEDATQLTFEDALFDGAIFGFNGLMQIPGEDQRAQAMSEIFRVLKPGSWFVFTTHDRDNPKFRSFWESEKLAWRRGKQNPALLEFGDRFEKTDLGDLFIHVPTAREVRALCKAAGFRVEADALRSKLANESPAVCEFSDDCRFWVVQKPA